MRLTFFILFSILTSSIQIIAAQEAPPGRKVPLVAVDPFEVMNPHDAFSALQNIIKFLELSGGRLQKGELAALYRGYSGDVRCVRLTPNLPSNRFTAKIGLIGFRNEATKGVFEDYNEKTFWTVDCESKSANGMIRTGEWLSANKAPKQLDDLDRVIPNISIFILSDKGFGVVHHVVTGTLVDVFVRGLAVALNEKSKDSNPLKMVGEEGINVIDASFAKESIEELRKNPYRFMKYAVDTSKVGLDDLEFSEMLRLSAP